MLKLFEYEIGVKHFVKSAADGDKVGEKLVGVVEMVAQEVSVNFSEVVSGFPAMEKVEESPFHTLDAACAHLYVETEVGFIRFFPLRRQLLKSPPPSSFILILRPWKQERSS